MRSRVTIAVFLGAVLLVMAVLREWAAVLILTPVLLMETYVAVRVYRRPVPGWRERRPPDVPR